MSTPTAGSWHEDDMLKVKKIIAWFTFWLGPVWLVIDTAAQYATLPEDINELWTENLSGTPVGQLIMLLFGTLVLLWVYLPWWSRFFTSSTDSASPLVNRSVTLHGAVNSGIIHTGDV